MESDVYKICRLCLNEIRDDAPFFCLDSDESNSVLIRQNLMKSIPEINLYLASTSIICNDCSAAIKFVHKFKKKCLQTDNHIRAYIKRASDVTIPVNLHKFVQQLKEQSATVDLDSSFTWESPKANKDARNDEEASTPSILSDEETEEQNNEQPTHLQLVDIDSVMFNTDAMNFALEIAETPADHAVAIKINPKNKNNRLDNLITRWKKKTYYDCSVCSYRTVFESNLNTHMKSHAEANHKKVAKKVNIFPTSIFFECNTCGQKMPTKRGLTLHMKIHSRKQLICKFYTCPFKTSSKTALSIHLRTHKKDNVSVREESAEVVKDKVSTSIVTSIQDGDEFKRQNETVVKRKKETKINQGVKVIKTSDKTTIQCGLVTKTNGVVTLEDSEPPVGTNKSITKRLDYDVIKNKDPKILRPLESQKPGNNLKT